MRGVDLARTSFDFDLTFSALLMHPDGRIYHRYGGRDVRGAEVWLGLDSWSSLLAQTLEEHADYSENPDPPPAKERLVLEEVPAFMKRDKGECIHCHSVFPALYEEALAAGEWTEDDRWVYPPPGRIGLDLDNLEQARVTKVIEGSAAERAGFRAGDLLVRAAAQRLATASDLSQVLHDFSPQGGSLAFDVDRGDQVTTLELQLSPGWKRGTPLDFSWRAFKWGFTPAPGFGGPLLDSDARRKLGLEPDAFAFRVTYFVTWNENRRYGVEAGRAGLREGDVVVSIDGKQDFVSVDHFHAWWRMTRAIGSSVKVEVIRGGRHLVHEVKVLE